MALIRVTSKVFCSPMLTKSLIKLVFLSWWQLWWDIGTRRIWRIKCRVTFVDLEMLPSAVWPVSLNSATLSLSRSAYARTENLMTYSESTKFSWYWRIDLSLKQSNPTLYKFRSSVTRGALPILSEHNLGTELSQGCSCALSSQFRQVPSCC